MTAMQLTRSGRFRQPQAIDRIRELLARQGPHTWMTATTVASRLGLNPSTAGAALRRLEVSGEVERQLDVNMGVNSVAAGNRGKESLWRLIRERSDRGSDRSGDQEAET